MELSQLLGILLLLGLLWTAAFFQLSIILWTTLLAAGLIVVSILGHLALAILVLLWIPFLVAAAFANLHQLRQRYIVQPLLARLQKQIPTISRTEQEAIDAGDTWWEKELFCGRPNWKKLYDIPRPTLSQEEKAFLDNQVNQLCSMVNDWDIIYKDQNLSNQVWAFLKKEKFFAMVIPKEYGGLGFSALAHSTIITKIATRSISAAVTTMVPNSLGPGELLVRYGTDEQKSHYLPGLAAATEIPCFALTAPEAGSDAGSIPDTGIVCYGQYQDKEILGIKLNWDKRYITLAPMATLLGLAIHLYDPEQLLGNKTDIGITLCLIPTSHPGVEIGNRHYPMYTAFMNGPTRGKDVFIPMDWIIGGSKMAGQGWRMLMESLSIGRSISLPALSTACANICYRITGAYSKVRRQFNTSIANFEGVEEALGYISGYTYMLEACRVMTAGAVDLHINPAIVSAIAKYHMTEMARHVVSHGMDVHSGQMIQVGPRNVLANIYIAVPISITVEGANILTRNLIIFGQGAIRCHPYLLKEIALMAAEKPQIKAIDSVLMSHIGFFISNLLRNFAYGLTGGLFIFASGKNKRIKKYKRQLTRMSAALALLADSSLMLLGGSLKRRERISARLGDIMSQLYLASTVLKYFHDNNHPSSDLDNVAWAMEHCLHKVQVACNELFDNFPMRWIGKLLGFVIFPFGPAYAHPKDKLHHAIIENMTTPSEMRDRVTQFCYLSNQEEDLSYKLDKALVQISATDGIAKKLNKALQSGKIPRHYNMTERLQIAQQAGILTPEELHIFKEYEALKDEIIKVNEFSFDMREVIA